MVLAEGKNDDQGYSIKTIDKMIYVAGKTPIGVLYGVYELLEQYGVYFQISGEKLPEKTNFIVRDINISSAPVFKYRGLLPWDNFLCGMSSYDLEDYKLLIDRAVRLKFNMIQFHFYPGMAFFTEKWNGEPVAPSMTGSPVDVFETSGAIAEKVFGDTEIFGSQVDLRKRPF